LNSSTIKRYKIRLKHNINILMRLIRLFCGLLEWSSWTKQYKTLKSVIEYSLSSNVLFFSFIRLASTFSCCNFVVKLVCDSIPSLSRGFCFRYYYYYYYYYCGPGSSVGIATDYGLDGPGIESGFVRVTIRVW
jgi:hypothetical protein